MSERGASERAGWWPAQWRAISMTIVATLGVGVLAALMLTLADANRERDRALAAQSHSFEVMILTRSLAGAMARAEATLGRFVISGDRAQGQRFSDEWIQAGQQIERLDGVTADNPVQQGRMFALRQAYQERGDELSLVALSTRYKKNEQALSRYYAARNAAALTRIDTLLEGFIAAERTVLAQRRRAAEATIARANRAAAGFAAFGALLALAAVALGWLAVRASGERAYAAAEAEAARDRGDALETAVAQATAELHAEARDREAAESKLRQMQKMEAVGQLTGGIAHDFNNMLAVVLGGLELARRRIAEGSDDVARHLDTAMEGASRATALTRRLLSFARSEPLAPKSADPAAVIAGMSDLLDRTLGDGIRVVTRGRGGWHVWVDQDGLENAILNLAVNARDAMDGRGTLTIVTGQARLAAEQVGHCAAGDYTTVAVTDTGHGMSADVAERVFEPFFTTKPVGKGTGLGLSQIFGFVKASGGEIAIATAPGAGTTVTLYLPRHIAASAPTPAAAPVTIVPANATRTLDILLVEDDPRVLSATVEVLRELGHRPVACADPALATSVAAEMAAIDLVISDVQMPGKTGPELIAEMTALLPSVAVLFVTGFAGDGVAVGDFGGHRVLSKPYTMMALAAAIDTAMAARPSDPPRLAAAS